MTFGVDGCVSFSSFFLFENKAPRIQSHKKSEASKSKADNKSQKAKQVKVRWAKRCK